VENETVNKQQAQLQPYGFSFSPASELLTEKWKRERSAFFGFYSLQILKFLKDKLPDFLIPTQS
jgi:hypothetical protein